MVVPTQPARRLQPRKSSFPGDRDEAPGAGGEGTATGCCGGARRCGARFSCAQGPRRGVPSGRPRPRARAQGGGRKSGCRPPGPEGWAGGRKLRRGLPPRRFSNFCCRSRCAQTAVRCRRRRRAPSPRGGRLQGGGGRRTLAAGLGSSAAMARRGGGCRPLHLPRRGPPAPIHLPEPELTQARPRRRRARSAAPPGPRTACLLSPGAEMGEGGHSLGLEGADLRWKTVHKCGRLGDLSPEMS
uniref:Uncharacterized protein LOC109691306 n=1 Tax=Castor canadensis TaxID=51338 RepID=A0A8B7V4A9_CASCN|nr:uncharacterized protein LOC109691306 [Castor canadensis]